MHGIEVPALNSFQHGHLAVELTDTQSVAPRIAGYGWCRHAFHDAGNLTQLRCDQIYRLF